MINGYYKVRMGMLGGHSMLPNSKDPQNRPKIYQREPNPKALSDIVFRGLRT